MADTIENYGDLKAAVGRYINRTNLDFTTEIPTFIQFCERKIFRILRCPANEEVLEIAEGWSGSTEFSKLTLPNDYLEAKLLTMGSNVLQRVSDTRMSAKLRQNPVTGQPTEFARIGKELFFYPPPDTAYALSLVYYKDYSGQLISDTATTEFLRIIPDAYLYGACLEAEPWLKNDARIQIWSELWKSVLNGVNEQAAEAEYSGSNVAVQSVASTATGGYG